MKMIMDEVSNMNERREYLANEYIGPVTDTAIDEPTDNSSGDSEQSLPSRRSGS